MVDTAVGSHEGLKLASGFLLDNISAVDTAVGSHEGLKLVLADS